MPQSYKTEEGYRLGQWVNVQRTNKKGLDPSRLQRLEALSGWDWDPYLSRWEEGFSRLKQFSEREGHCRVPRSYKTEEGYRLGAWVNTQRNDKDSMRPDRRQRLEALSGWSWKPQSDLWEVKFSRSRRWVGRNLGWRSLRGYQPRITGVEAPARRPRHEECYQQA